MSDGRLIALRVLQRVEEGGAYADRALSAELTRARLPAVDRALAAHLVTGVVKQRRTLDHTVQILGGRAPDELQPEIRDILRLGAFQLLFSERIPPHAAVATSVDLARARGAARAAGLVNAILRRVAEGGRELLAALPDGTATEAALRRSYPDWIAELWWDAYGADVARALMDAGNEPAELALRVNMLRPGAAQRATAELAAAGARWHGDPELPEALVVDGGFDVAASAAFARGDVAPMSRAAQRIGRFLAPEPGMRVLDACSAPGGKAAHLAALIGGADGVVCVERDPRRVRQLRTTLRRLGADAATVVEADVLALPARLGAFDAILLDAPCTGLGTVSSRADLRWRRRAEDVPALAAMQAQMVDALAARLEPRGRLCYAVCTLSPAENRGALAGRTPASELTTWPHRGDGDGFYTAIVG